MAGKSKKERKPDGMTPAQWQEWLDKRREARETAFCLLFEQCVNGERMDDIIHAAAEARDLIPDSYAERVAFGAEENIKEIDSLISANLKGWSLRRISKVTLALLRLAIYEMYHEDEVPASVSINEAVELAKLYGGKDDSAYINGVLSSIYKAMTAAEGGEE